MVWGRLATPVLLGPGENRPWRRSCGLLTALDGVCGGSGTGAGVGSDFSAAGG